MDRSVLCLLTVAIALVNLSSVESFVPLPDPEFCPPPPLPWWARCDQCYWDCHCPFGLRCCKFECGMKCAKVGNNGLCPKIDNCDKCSTDGSCGRCQECKCHKCCKQCVQKVSPLTGPCHECSQGCPCRKPLLCCWDGCGDRCLAPYKGQCPISKDALMRPCDKCFYDRDCGKCHVCECKGCCKTCVSTDLIGPEKDECRSDSDCKFKCCYDGCKRACLNRAGDCPSPNPWQQCHQCSLDGDCGKCEKCIRKGCWRKCVKSDLIGPEKDECRSDSDCKFKCCYDGCKRACLNRAGDCPSPNPWQQCHQCSLDGDCGKCEKCIRKGCWRKCVKSEFSRPGFCPIMVKCIPCKGNRCPPRFVCCLNGCGVMECVPSTNGKCPPPGDCCESDCDCRHPLKCCRSRCGNKCVKPVKSEFIDRH